MVLFACLSINFGCYSTKDPLLLVGKFLGLKVCLQAECTTHQGVFISCIRLMLCHFYYCCLCNTVGVLALFLFCPKKQENNVSALMALQYRNYKLHLLEQTIYVRVESRKEKEKQCFPGKRLLMARTWKQRENLNSGTHLDRYFKDYLNRSDQQRKAITSGRRQQKWEGDRHGKSLKLRKGRKGNNVMRLDKAAYGNPK